MARQLNADGHKVYGTYRRDSDPLPGVTYIRADVRDQDSLKNAVDQVIEAEGRIDTLISNAGMGIGGPLEFTSIEDAQRQMDVNFMGMVRLVSLVVPVMRQQRHGHIICISSIGGLMGLPYQGMYSASKFAIEGYCQAGALAAYPGYAKSMQSIEHDENSGLQPDRLARRIGRIVRKRHPRNRYIIATLVQKASVVLKAILPAKWFDKILGSYYEL